NADFRVYSGSGFLESQFHVVAKVGAALRAAATSTASAAKNILEAEEVPENILEFIEDGLIDAAVESATRQPCIAEAVVGGALLHIGKNRVRFGGFAKLLLRFVLGLRIAVRVPLQGCFAVG